MAKDTVTFALEGDVSLDEFARALDGLAGLMQALSHEVGDRVAISWRVADLRAGSATAILQGEADETSAVERVVSAYGAVGRALERRQPVPYSARVRRQAEVITSVLSDRVVSIRFETPDDDAVVYPRDTVAAMRDVQHDWAAYGMVEGTVQALNERGALRFTLYDALHDRAVTCYLSEEQHEIMRDVWGKRALVEGRLSRDPISGRPTAMRDVLSVRPIGNVPEGDFRAARAALPVNANVEPPEEIIRRMRDAE